MMNHGDKFEFNDNSDDLQFGVEIALLILNKRDEPYRNTNHQLGDVSSKEMSRVNVDNNESAVKNYIESVRCFWKLYNGFDIDVLLRPGCDCEKGLEHLQSPVVSDYLLEQWTVQYENTRQIEDSENTKRIKKYGLIQAVSSQLHFSHLNSWWSKTSGQAPKNVICVVLPPNSSNAKKCTILHEFQSIHINNKFLKISMKSKPRCLSIPSIQCGVHNSSTMAHEDPPNAYGLVVGSNGGHDILPKYDPIISLNMSKPYRKRESLRDSGKNKKPEKNVKRIVHSDRILLGTFEDSVLEHRVRIEKVVDGFTVDLGCSGSTCPDHVQFPVKAKFFSFPYEPISTSYLVEGEMILKKGYMIPKNGKIQMTLKNPEGTVVTIFLIPYDFSDMPIKSCTYMRHKIFYVPPEETAHTRKWLRYLIQLKIKCSKAGRIAIYSNVQMIVCKTPTVDNVDELGNQQNNVTRCVSEYPREPKYFHY